GHRPHRRVAPQLSVPLLRLLGRERRIEHDGEVGALRPQLRDERAALEHRDVQVIDEQRARRRIALVERMGQRTASRCASTVSCDGRPFQIAIAPPSTGAATITPSLPFARSAHAASPPGLYRPATFWSTYVAPVWVFTWPRSQLPTTSTSPLPCWSS